MVYRTGYALNGDGTSNVEFGTEPDFLVESKDDILKEAVDIIREEN